jgi:hypothetical protein
MNSKLLSITAGLCLALQTACASAKMHDDSVAAAGSSASAGRAGQAAGAGGMAAAAAGTFSLTDLMPMCAPVVPGDVVVACGDLQCPDLPATASAGCIVTCCTPDAKCGTRTTDTRLSTLGVACVASATEDPRCPMSALGGTSLPGCCDANGHCGSIVSNQCVPGFNTPRCDQSTADAGL